MISEDCNLGEHQPPTNFRVGRQSGSYRNLAWAEIPYWKPERIAETLPRRGSCEIRLVVAQCSRRIFHSRLLCNWLRDLWFAYSSGLVQ